MNTNVNNNIINCLALSSGASYCLLFLKTMKKYIHINKEDKRLFFNNFNYFIGVSGGSIIIYSFLLGYNIDETIEFYEEIVTGFGNLSYFSYKRLYNLIRYNSFFKNDKFINILKKHIENSPLNYKFKNGDFRKINGLEKITSLTSENFTLSLIDLIYPEKKIFIVSYNLNKKSPTIFTNYINFNDNLFFNENLEPNNLKIMNIVMTSAAAPIIFQDINYLGYTYLDGALTGLGTPSYLAYLITKKIEKVEKRINNVINILEFMIEYNYDINKFDFIELSSNHVNLTKLLVNLSENFDEDVKYEKIYFNLDMKKSGFLDNINYFNNIKIKNETMKKINLFLINIS